MDQLTFDEKEIKFHAARVRRLCVLSGYSPPDDDKTIVGAVGTIIGACLFNLEKRNGLELAARYLEKKASDYATEYGCDDMGGLSFGRGSHAQEKLDYYNGLLEQAEEIRLLAE